MNLAQIAPFPGGGLLRVVVETPKGSRNKFDYDPELKAFRLAKTLPEGMVFPYDFGLIPQTMGEDGDPLDVMLLMSESTPPGCIVDCRLVGVIRGKQKEKGKKTLRNDRFIAVSITSCELGRGTGPDNLHPGMMKQLQDFFTTYNALEERVFKPLGVVGVSAALKLIKRQWRKPKKKN